MAWKLDAGSLVLGLAIGAVVVLVYDYVQFGKIYSVGNATAPEAVGATF